MAAALNRPRASCQETDQSQKFQHASGIDQYLSVSRLGQYDAGNVLRRDAPDPFAAFASGLASALAPAFSAAMAPVQTAADTNLAGVSLIKSEAPSVIPTADIIGPAHSAAAPVLSELLGGLISVAQPLVLSAGAGMPAGTAPVASLAAPLQSAILPPVESAIGPLVSAVAPAVVAALAPEVSQLSSPLGPVESGLVAPLESALVPVLSDVVGEAVSALTGVNAPIASALTPLLSAIDSAVLPLVTSVVSAVWPAIGPAVTPLNPVICALQPAEVPVGSDASGLIPVQCVSITSGNIVPVSTGVATMSPSAAVSVLVSTTAANASQSSVVEPSLPLPSLSVVPIAVTPPNPFASVSSSRASLSVNNGTTSLLASSSSFNQTVTNGVAAPPLISITEVFSVSPLSAVLPASAVSESNVISVSEPPVMTCVLPATTSPTAPAAQPTSGVQSAPVANSLSSASAAGAAPSSSTVPVNTDDPASASTEIVPQVSPLPTSPVPPSTAGSPESTSPPIASPAVTQGPASVQGQVFLFSYGSQTVSFPAMMLPGGGMVASFMGSLFALPVTAGLARRMEPIAVGNNFDFDAFADELSSRLSERLSPQQVVISSSKGGIAHQQEGSHGENELKNSESEAAHAAKNQKQGSEISRCPSANGTTFVSQAGSDYSVMCDTNWVGRDIDYLATYSFDKCVDICDALNAGSDYMPCAAALYVENAPSGSADCYLKSATDNPSTNISAYKFIAAVLTSSAGSPAKSFRFRLSEQPTIPAAYIPGSSPYATSTTYTSGTTTIHFASGINIATPLVSTTLNLDVATTQPTSQYFSQTSVPPSPQSGSQKRSDGIENSEVDFNLANDEIDAATGVVEPVIADKTALKPLSNIPHLSRDGGKGGMVNGQHLFMFADTAVYTTEKDDSNGHYVNYASSSVATDVGMNALYGNPLTLQDNAGEFANAEGALRGFIPLTTGETAFNAKASKDGFKSRYSVWPESSLIPFNSTSSIVVAPIVYSHTDPETLKGKFTYAGNSLVTVQADDEVTGPNAQRTVGRLFNASSVEWGNIGGLRSWGQSGVGGNDGYIYLFGNVRGGLLLARTAAQSVGNIASYEYWNGIKWSSTPVSDEDTGAHVLEGSFMDVDIFYSPRHLTFIAVYTNIYADSTFYWRYLKAPQALRPGYAGGDPREDIAEALTQYKWSEEQTLFRATKGINGGYAYAGGAHLGYFGQEDIANGGDKMLLTWTMPTGQDPASRHSAYQLGSGIVKWV